MEEIDFKQYCKGKRIDPELLKNSEGELYGKLESIFMQMSPASFTAQKLFIINDLRRRFNYAPPVTEKPNKEKPSSSIKPKLALKPKQAIIPGTKQKGATPKIPAPKIATGNSESSERVKVSAKPKIPNPKSSTLKPNIPTPIKTGALKPKISTSNSSKEQKEDSALKPKITSGGNPTLKPVIKTKEKPEQTALKPKIPTPKKASALKPKIPPKK